MSDQTPIDASPAKRKADADPTTPPAAKVARLGAPASPMKSPSDMQFSQPMSQAFATQAAAVRAYDAALDAMSSSGAPLVSVEPSLSRAAEPVVLADDGAADAYARKNEDSSDSSDSCDDDDDVHYTLSLRQRFHGYAETMAKEHLVGDPMDLDDACEPGSYVATYVDGAVECDVPVDFDEHLDGVWPDLMADIVAKFGGEVSDHDEILGRDGLQIQMKVTVAEDKATITRAWVAGPITDMQWYSVLICRDGIDHGLYNTHAGTVIVQFTADVLPFGYQGEVVTEDAWKAMNLIISQVSL